MKTLLLFSALLTAGLASAQSADVTGNRHLPDANSSINKTDPPRSLNHNNATNSTARDWNPQYGGEGKAQPAASPVQPVSQTPGTTPENKGSGKPAGITKKQNTPAGGKAEDNMKTSSSPAPTKVSRKVNPQATKNKPANGKR
jgi:opacity protein-like surface antigen